MGRRRKRERPAAMTPVEAGTCQRCGCHAQHRDYAGCEHCREVERPYAPAPIEPPEDWERRRVEVNAVYEDDERRLEQVASRCGWCRTESGRWSKSIDVGGPTSTLREAIDAELGAHEHSTGFIAERTTALQRAMEAEGHYHALADRYRRALETAWDAMAHVRTGDAEDWSRIGGIIEHALRDPRPGETQTRLHWLHITDGDKLVWQLVAELRELRDAERERQARWTPAVARNGRLRTALADLHRAHRIAAKAQRSMQKRISTLIEERAREIVARVAAERACERLRRERLEAVDERVQADEAVRALRAAMTETLAQPGLPHANSVILTVALAAVYDPDFIPF